MVYLILDVLEYLSHSLQANMLLPYLKYIKDKPQTTHFECLAFIQNNYQTQGSSLPEWPSWEGVTFLLMVR